MVIITKNNLPPTNACTWTKVSHFVTCLNQLHGHWSLIYFDIALLHSFDNLELVLPPVSDTHTNDDIWRRDQWWSRSMVHVVHGAVPGQATPGKLRLPAYSSMLDIKQRWTLNLIQIFYTFSGSKSKPSIYMYITNLYASTRQGL